MSGRRAEEGLQRGTGGKEMEVADEDQMVEGLRRAREGSCDEGASSVAVRNAVVSASPRFEGGEDRHVASRSSLLVNNDCQQRKGVEARSDKADFEEGHIATEDSLGNEGLTRRRLNMRELKLSSRRWNDDEDRILIDYVKRYGDRSWRDVNQTGLQRSPNSCRLRFENHLRTRLQSRTYFRQVPGRRLNWPPMPRSSPPADIHFYPSINKRPGIALGSPAKRSRYETWTPRTMAWVRGVSSSGETVLVPEGQPLYAPAFRYVHMEGSYEAWGQEGRGQYESSGGTPISIRNLPPIRTRVSTGFSPFENPLCRCVSRSVSSPDIDFQALPYARAPEAGYHPHALARAASFDALARAPAAAYEAFAHAPTAGYDDVIAAASAGDYEARVRAYAPGRDALARAPSGSSVQLFSPDLPEDMTPGEVWLEPQNLADEPPHEATAAFKTIADGSAFPGAAEMEMGDEGAAELNEQLQVDHQNGVDLVSAHLIDTLSSTYQQYEAGMETPLSRERDRLLALESVQAPGPYHARWETDSLEQGMDAGLAEPPVEPLHASNLGSLFPALDAFDDIPSSVKSSQSLPLAVQDPVFGAFDGTLGDSGVNALQVVPMVGEPVPQTAGAGNNRAETEEGAVLEGGRRNSSSMNSEDPPETGLAGSFHDVLLEGLEEESKRKEAVADETVQEMTIQFDGSSAHMTNPAARDPALELPVFCDFFKEDLPSIAGLDELDTWREAPFEAPAIKCASDGSCGSSSPVLWNVKRSEAS